MIIRSGGRGLNRGRGVLGGGSVPPFAGISGTVAAWDMQRSTILQGVGGSAATANDVVGFISDVTGNGLPLLQSSAAVKPSVTADGTGILYSSDWMATTANASAFASGLSQAFSVVIAYGDVDFNSAPTYWAIDHSSGGAGTGYHFLRTLSPGAIDPDRRTVVRRASNSPLNVQTATTDGAFPTASVLIFTYSGSAYQLYDNNTLLNGASLVQSNSIDLDAFRLGNVAENGVVQTPQTILTWYAAAVYDHELSSAERTIITDDLRARYSL